MPVVVNNTKRPHHLEKDVKKQGPLKPQPLLGKLRKVRVEKGQGIPRVAKFNWENYVSKAKGTEVKKQELAD